MVQYTFADFSPKAGISLYTVSLISPEGSAKLQWAGTGGAQRPVLSFKEPKKTGVRRTWARKGGKKLLFYKINV